jgi:hypothetical protein
MVYADLSQTKTFAVSIYLNLITSLYKLVEASYFLCYPLMDFTKYDFVINPTSRINVSGNCSLLSFIAYEIFHLQLLLQNYFQQLNRINLLHLLCMTHNGQGLPQGWYSLPTGRQVLEPV